VAHRSCLSLPRNERTYVPIGASRFRRGAAEMCLSLAMGRHSGAPGPDDVRVPVAAVLSGLEIHPLEPGETALEAFVLIKCLDADGSPSWSYRATNRLNREELLGALVVQVDLLRHELRHEWDDQD
jgi:hypothetical protein